MKKRGQAAMEFLMTYGWAILAAIIVVGVLWYIIGDPGNLAGNKFQISSPFTSEGVAFDATANNITIEIRNGEAEQVDVTNIEIESCTDATSDTFTDQAVTAGDLSGAVAISCDGTALVSGNRFNGDITIFYTVGSGSVTQQASGSVTGKVP